MVFGLKQMLNRIFAKKEKAFFFLADNEAEDRDGNHFRHLLYADADLVYRMNADWTTVTCLHGWGRINWNSMNSPWSDPRLPHGQKILIKEAKARAIDRKLPFDLEHQIVHEDGSLGWIHSLAIPIIDQQGRLVEWLGKAKDINDRRTSQTALLESEEKLRLLLDEVPVAVALLDRQMNYVAGTNHWKHLFGLEDVSLLGRSLHELLPEVAGRWKEVHQKALHGETILIEEDCIQRSEGKTRWLRWEVQPWFDSSGEIRGIRLVTEDINESKKIRDMLVENEESYRSYFDNFAIGTAQLNSRGEFMQVNERFCQLTGYSRQELLSGMTPVELTHPEDREATIKMCAEVFAGSREFYDLEKRYLRKDGTVTWVKVTANGVLDAEGKIRYTTGIIQDISEQKRFETALRGTERELECELHAMNRLHALCVRLFTNDDLKTALLDILDNAIAEVEADFGSIHMVDRATGMLETLVHRGFPREWLSFFHELQCEAGSDYAIALKNGMPIFSEDCGLDSVFPPHRNFASLAGVRAVKWIPLKNREGISFGFLSICFKTRHVLSDRDRRLIDMYATHAADFIEWFRFQDAIKDSARKDEFLATLAHELRNPLAPISSAIQLLGRTNEPREKQPQVLEMIARNVQHMTRMVDDLLEVSRITRGKIELKKEWADIAQLVRNAVETSGPSIQAGGHHLTVSVQPSGLEVYVDSVRLTQVVANLLNNAAKFTPFGGRIEVVVERAGSYAVLKVRDNGPGIPDERLRDIFDLFTQVHVEQRQSGGLGIGLALVKRLIELHDGTVEACHAEGGGAEFIVQIPIAAIAPGEQEHKKQGEIATAASSSRRILIVDDNADAADSLAMLLSAEGHLIATAYDGGSAIEKAFTFNPHLIFLDLGMPGMDGFATAKRIRSLPGTSHIRIVALTGWGQERDRLGTRIAGFQNHLVKPVQLSDLQRVIQEADSISNRKDFDAVEVEPTLPKSMENVSEATDLQSPATVPEDADRRDSKVAHDLANCFFGIRMAAELLKRLEISEPSIQNQVQRVVDSMEHDCEEGEGLIETIRRRMQ